MKSKQVLTARDNARGVVQNHAMYWAYCNIVSTVAPTPRPSGDVSPCIKCNRLRLPCMWPTTKGVRCGHVGKNGRCAPHQTTCRLQCPVIKLLGAPTVVVPQGFPFADPGAKAFDHEGNDISKDVFTEGNVVNTRVAFADRSSCSEILHAAKRRGIKVGDGLYYITSIVKGKETKMLVWCDMRTDGGGYTVRPVNHGLRTRSVHDANSCTDLGMQLLVPRTREHLRAVIERFGPEYYRVATGVYGTSARNLKSR